MKLNELKIGDKVQVASAWGSGPMHFGIVKDVLEDVKNDCPGIDYVLDSGANHWAYLSQVIRKFERDENNS